MLRWLRYLLLVLPLPLVGILTAVQFVLYFLAMPFLIVLAVVCDADPYGD